MNDRFRFRAWNVCDDELKGGMLYDVQNETDFDYFLESKKLVVEQCTGLKDKNGRLIYEGDIVECFYDHFDGNFTEKKVTGVVKWGVGEWSVQNEKKGDWYYLSYANYDEKHLQSDSVKVIGNIHENPELLEDK
jgi:uncharacterized phage protein (TIGR01671 family)